MRIKGKQRYNRYSVVSDVQCTRANKLCTVHCAHCNELAFQWFVCTFIVHLIERFFNLHAHQFQKEGEYLRFFPFFPLLILVFMLRCSNHRPESLYPFVRISLLAAL